MKKYRLKVTYGNVPKGSIMGFYENVTPDPALFEELPESQEGAEGLEYTDGGPVKPCICGSVRYDVHGKCKKCGLLGQSLEVNPQQTVEEEECKHAWELKRGKTVACLLCGLKEQVLKPQPKQKPSTSINQEVNRLVDDSKFGLEAARYYATLKFLDQYFTK